MWSNLPKEKKKKVLENAINKLDNFNDLCFDHTHLSLYELRKEKYSTLNSTEKVLKVLLHPKGHPLMTKQMFKEDMRMKLSIRKKSTGESIMIASSVVCSIRAGLNPEYFVLSLMVNELSNLYYNNILVNEMNFNSDAEEKPKKKKKRKRKKKKKRSKVIEESEVQLSDKKDEKMEELTIDQSVKHSNTKKSMTYEDLRLVNRNVIDFGENNSEIGFKSEEEEELPIKPTVTSKRKKSDTAKQTKKNEVKGSKESKKRNSGGSHKQTKQKKLADSTISSVKYWGEDKDLKLNKEDSKAERKISKNYADSSYKYKSRKNTFVGKKASLVIDSPTKKPSTRKDSKFAPIKLSANKKFFNSKKENQTEFELRVKEKIHECVDDELKKITTELMTYSQTRSLAKRTVQERIDDIVRNEFKAEKLFVKEYGSYATKLLTPFSDLDLAIQGISSFEKKTTVSTLELLINRFKDFPFIKKINPILTANVPVIKLDVDPSLPYKETDCFYESVIIKVDIVVDTVDKGDEQSTALRTTEYTNYCIKRYPSFFRNILLLKYGLNCNNLSNAYNGGLVSYGLCILYVAYLESHNFNDSTDHLGTLLSFLDFVSLNFDQNVYAVYFGTNYE